MTPPNDELNKHLKQLVERRIRSAVDPEKTEQYYEIRRNVLYYEGEQFLTPTLVNGRYVDYVRSGSSIRPSTGGDEDDFGDDYVTNVYKGDVRKYVAVLGQKPPNVNCVAEIATNPDHQRRAKAGDEITRHLHGLWDVERLHMEVAYTNAVKGPAFLYTPYVVNGERYGQTEVPVYEEQEVAIGPPGFQCPACGLEGMGEETQCPQCGSPVIQTPPETEMMMAVVETEKYDNGSVECHIYSGLEVTTPFRVKRIEDAPWLRLETEHDLGQLAQAFPDHADKILQMGQNRRGSQGRWVRDQMSAFSKGDFYTGRHNVGTHTQIWLRPSMYFYFPENVNIDGVPVRDLLKQQYPDGLRVELVGEEVVRLTEECMDYVWAVIQTETAETIYSQPYMNDMIPLQDQVNDYTEIARESAERTIPSWIFDPNVLNPDTLERMGRRYAEMIPASAGSVGDFSRAFYYMKPGELSPEHLGLAQQLLEVNREITGILPSIFGGGEGHQTLGEAEIDRNQALMVLGAPWFFMRNGWARAFRNGIIQVARNSPDGRLHFPKAVDPFGEGVPLPMGYEDLLKGGWKVAADEAMPLSAAQRRVWIERLLQSQNPEIPGRLGMFHPDNLAIIHDLLGLTGWTIPENKDREAIQDIIERLAMQQPVQEMQADPMNPMAPMQPIELPSEQPDPYLHDPAFTSRAIREWLLSEDGQRLQEENPAGWQNVYLYGRMLFDQMQMMQQPPPEQLPAGAEGGEAPPPEEAPQEAAPMVQ